jgi:ketosteroid isomerase-like protein
VRTARGARLALVLAVTLVAPLALGGCSVLRLQAARREVRETAQVDAVLSRLMRHFAVGGVDSIATLLAPEFVLVQAGRRFTRTEYVDGLRAQRTTDIATRFTNRKARVIGDAAYITYDLQSSYSSGGVKMSAEEQGTIVLRKTDDGWRILLWQISDVPPGAG